jgi:hypothetical protein
VLNVVAQAVCKVRATFDYVATESGELSIRKGDIINVIERDETGWWKGELKGLVGFFPSNFSEVLPATPSEEASLRRMSMAPKPVKDNASTSSEEFVKAKHNYKVNFFFCFCFFSFFFFSQGSAADGELSFGKVD